MWHRVPALRMAFIIILLFAVADLTITGDAKTATIEAIVMSVLGLFLLSPAADWIERKPR